MRGPVLDSCRCWLWPSQGNCQLTQYTLFSLPEKMVVIVSLVGYSDEKGHKHHAGSDLTKSLAVILNPV